MKRGNFFLGFFYLIFLCIVTFAGCNGGGGGGGNGSSDADVATITPLVEGGEGLFDGAVVRNFTQKITVALPNPGGEDSSTFDGKAFLVINGDRIQMQPKQSENEAERAEIVFYKGGEIHTIKGPSPDARFLRSKSSPGSWIFEATFSINAGPNTLKFEVYNLSDTLWAASDQWKIVGAVNPTDLVVTLWWDTNYTDIDLHVYDGYDHCYFWNRTTGDPSRGRMVLDYDDTDGYGPEHVTVDNVIGTQQYEIRVYYFDDHTPEADETTPTLCHVTVQVAGQTVLQDSATLSSSSHNYNWTTGAHVWEVGKVEVSGAVTYTVNLGEPDLRDFPKVSIPLTVTDPSHDDEGVSDLTDENIFLINAGMAMSPLNITSLGDGRYTLEYTDIIAGKRDVYVYVYAPYQSGQGFAGGLSETRTYGDNYVLLVGLTEYPPSGIAVDQWYDASGPVPHAKVTIRSLHKVPDGAGDFTATFTDSTGGRDPVTVTATGMTGPGTADGLGQYDLSFPTPDNYLDYDKISLKFKKAAWLINCINDVNDVEAAIKAIASSTFNTMYATHRIERLTNAGATKSVILGRIDTIAGAMNKYDLFMFYFSGHGSDGDTDANQYLCAYEDEHWISVTDLKNKLNLVPNPGENITNVIVLLDACFSGNFIDRGPSFFGVGASVEAEEKYRQFLPQKEEALEYGLAFRDLSCPRGISGTNYSVMTAVDGDHSAWDAGGLQNSVFTYYLVEGINVSGSTITRAKANTNHDVWVTTEEAFTYLQPKGREYVETNIKPGYPDALQEAQYYPDLSRNSRLIYCW